MDEIYNENISKLKDFLILKINQNNDVLNLTNITEYTTLLMKQIEKNQELSGTQKKEIILQVLKSYCHEYTILENDFLELNKIITNIIPNLIDTVIKVDNKLLTIKTVVKPGCCQLRFK
jgi:hypothetical protein